MNLFVVRYQEKTHKNVEFTQVIAKDEEDAVRIFTENITDYIEGSQSVLTAEEYQEIRENMGLSRNGIEERPEVSKKLLEIYSSEEFQKSLASGGYDY